MKRLRQSNLRLQLDKRKFLQKEVTYLEHIISENGILSDPSKLEAVNEFPELRKRDKKYTILPRTCGILQAIYRKIF